MLANANSLCRLSETNEKGIFNKLMVVQAGSIVEAALDQIIYRAQNYTKEGVPNIGDEELKKIRGTKMSGLTTSSRRWKPTSCSMALEQTSTRTCIS